MLLVAAPRRVASTTVRVHRLQTSLAPKQATIQGVRANKLALCASVVHMGTMQLHEFGVYDALACMNRPALQKDMYRCTAQL